MRQLYYIYQVQPEQERLQEPFVTWQELPQHASYSGEVQKEHRVLMAGHHLPNSNPSKKKYTRRETLKCIQLNLHHSRLATDNLTKIIEEENTDIYNTGDAFKGIRFRYAVLQPVIPRTFRTCFFSFAFTLSMVVSWAFKASRCYNIVFCFAWMPS